MPLVPTLLALLLATPVLLWTAVLLVQALAHLLPPARTPDGPAAGRATPSCAVLMPAHDEEDIIAATVASARAALRPEGRLLVIADNCSDRTASRARAAGAEVIERHDPARRGKGYALAHGIAALGTTPPDVILVLDADCQAHGDALDRLVSAAHRLQRPVQGRYDMLAPDSGSLQQRMAAFAWDFRGRFRAQGFHRLGLPCQLMGSGMALPWPQLARVDLASGHLVEDLKLGLDFALAGAPPRLLPQAVVSSLFPTNATGEKSQRQRWEHGHLSMALTLAPRLLWEALRDCNLALLAMVADMCVPPLALLCILITMNTTLGWALAHWGLVPAWIGHLGTGSLALFGAIILLGWWRVGRRWVGLGELATVPWYIVRKLPIYAGFFVRRQVQWIRTRRD